MRSSKKSDISSNNNNNNNPQVPPHDLLLTPKSLELSLSPPRAPPFGSAQRAVLTHHPAAASHVVRQLPWSRHYRVRNDDDDDDDDEAHCRHPPHETFRQRLYDQLQQRRRRRRASNYYFQQHPRPHPHLAETSADAVTRTVGLWWSVPRQNQFRDGGTFRAVADALVTASIPVLAVTHPSAAYRFWQLSRHNYTQEIRYGPHPLQRLDLLVPTTSNETQQPPARLIFFCHGGAWGSGQKWMYRLVADPYLSEGWAVAIPGYRTYPDGGTREQVHDMELALAALAQHRPEWFRRSTTTDASSSSSTTTQLTIMGHSSGAHIALLMLVERARERMLLAQHSWTAATAKHESVPEQPSLELSSSLLLLPDSYIGLSGPYDISHHFDYEAGRGVEELSPMKPANGHTRRQFRRHSPGQYLRDGVLGPCRPSQQRWLSAWLPNRLLLVHGMEDDTVPWTATAEAAKVLRSCGIHQVEEWYVPETGHQDMVLQIMLGGPTRDATVEWLRQCTNTKNSSSLLVEDRSNKDAATSPRDAARQQMRALQSKL